MNQSPSGEPDRLSFFMFRKNSLWHQLGDAIVLLGAISKFWSEWKEAANMGWLNYFKLPGSGFFESLISCAYCICIFLMVIFRLRSHWLEQVTLAVASVLVWTYQLYFLLGFRLTGHFVVMIWKMLTTDVVRFAIIYAVFLMGFSQAFFVLFEGKGHHGFLRTWQICFSAMLGGFEFDDFMENQFPGATVMHLLVFVVIVTILLFNLLIAMMGETYTLVTQDADDQWALERARIIFSLENKMSRTEREMDKNKYWIVKDEINRYLQCEKVDSKKFDLENSEVPPDILLRLRDTCTPHK